LTGLIEDEGMGENHSKFKNGTPMEKRGLHLAVWALEHGVRGPGESAAAPSKLTVILSRIFLADPFDSALPKRKAARADNFLTENPIAESPGDRSSCRCGITGRGPGIGDGGRNRCRVAAAHECLLLGIPRSKKTSKTVFWPVKY